MFDKSSVEIISGDKFDDKQPWILKDKHCAFVLFFADWCGHCQNLKPEYEKFADIAQFMHVYAVDSDKNKSLLSKINSHSKSPIKIQGYPTIVIYKAGKPIGTYEGKRTKAEMLKYAMKKLCNKECKCDKKV